MYAVIRTGGKQERVEEGLTLQVELLKVDQGQEVHFNPLLVVDGDRVISSSADLLTSDVTAIVLDEVKGPKVIGFKYKPKSNQRKRWGHRQKYSLIKVIKISA